MIPQQDWLTELPQESGDYLWVAMWGCNCCVRDSGVAWVSETCEGDDRQPGYTYKVGDKLMGIWWGKTKPDVYDGVLDVDGWLRLNLPDAKE